MAVRQISRLLQRAAPIASRVLADSSITKPYTPTFCRLVRLRLCERHRDCKCQYEHHWISDDIQVTTSSSAHWAVASELADSSKASKQGWGQTKIGQVLQAKVSCTYVLVGTSLALVRGDKSSPSKSLAGFAKQEVPMRLTGMRLCCAARCRSVAVVLQR